MDKMQLSKICKAKRYGPKNETSYLVYFETEIFDCNDFTSFASTARKSLKIILCFFCVILAVYILVNAVYSVSGSLNSAAVKLQS